jgi:hypothetical protein
MTNFLSIFTKNSLLLFRQEAAIQIFFTAAVDWYKVWDVNYLSYEHCQIVT